MYVDGNLKKGKYALGTRKNGGYVGE